MNDEEKMGTGTEESVESPPSTQQHVQYDDAADTSAVSAQSRWIWVDRIKRAYILLLGIAAIAFSIITIYSCAFFSYRSLDEQPWSKLMPPFDSLASASVGLFSFSATATDEGLQLSFLDGQCVEYDNPWTTGQSEYWLVAQWCAVVAPVAAFLALMQLVLESLCCRLRCSYLLIAFFFLAASALQGCSFMVFADREFW